MALNWYLTIRNLAKTDATAAELLEQLKKAETDDQKELAKQNAQEYLQKNEQSESDKSSEDTTVSETDSMVAEQDEQDNSKLCSETCDGGDREDRTTSESESPQEESKDDKKIMDLSQPAFTPRLAKYGINREEELFLKGVFVRKMTRDEKILMRRAIYQKKTQATAKIQAEFKAKRIAQKQKEANDPEVQKFHQERKYVSAIVDALEQHKNLGFIFSQIEGLTLDIFRELIKKPGNVNAFNKANPNFITNFHKKYGV